MSIPGVNIQFANGNLGGVQAIEDGVCGLLCSATDTSSFKLGKAYLLTSLEDLTALGFNANTNADAYKAVKDFYTEAPTGTKLWIYGVEKKVTIDELVSKENNYAKALVESANGEIKILFVSVTDDSDYSPAIANGLDGKIYTAITNAQALAEDLTSSLYAPMLVVLPARHYTGNATELTDLTTMTNNRVSVVLGDTKKDSDDAAIGLFVGRLASLPVHRSVARVKNGAIKADTMYIKSTEVDKMNIDAIHDKGFITPRTFVGMTGYYWSDDMTCTKASDDYSMIQRRRTIDKAYRIAYKTLVEELSEEYPVNDNGEISAPMVKAIETKLESAILNDMGVAGNLGNDPTDANDLGVRCHIPEGQNIVATSRVKVILSIKPFGYAKYIDVELGYMSNN